MRLPHILDEFIEKKVTPKELHLLPGEYFFTRKFELIEELPLEELKEFAELSLESLSPFPLDQLLWGFLSFKGSKSILVYAVPKHRLIREKYPETEPFYHVFPHFISWINGESFSEDQTLISRYHESISILKFKAGDPIPETIESFSLPQNASNNSGEESPRSIFRFLPDPSSITPKIMEKGYFKLQNAILQEEQTFLFQHQWIPGSDESPSHTISEKKLFHASEDMIWNADLRNESFIQQEKSNRRLSARIWNLTQTTGVVLAALLTFQFLLLIASSWINHRENKIESQRTTANRIQEQRNFIDKLDAFSQKEIKPFSMLSIINGCRPPSVYLSRINATDWNQVEIEGMGQSAQKINIFKNALLDSPFIMKSSILERKTSRGKSTFSIHIEFTSLPDLEPMTSTPDTVQTNHPAIKHDHV